MEVIPPLITTGAEDQGAAIPDRSIGEVEAGEVSDEVLGAYACR